VSCKATLAEPAEDIPANGPPGQSDLRLGQRALRVVMGGAARVGAVREFADEFERPLEGVEAVEAVVADVEVSLTERTGILLNREYALGESGVGRPGKTHRSPSRNR